LLVHRRFLHGPLLLAVITFFTAALLTVVIPKTAADGPITGSTSAIIPPSQLALPDPVADPVAPDTPTLALVEPPDTAPDPALRPVLAPVLTAPPALIAWTRVVLTPEIDGTSPLANAWISGDGQLLQTNTEGEFTLPGTATDATVVAPGFWPARISSGADGPTVLQPLEVRAVFLPYEKLWDPQNLDWAIGLADAGLITAIVIDVKEEGGGVLPIVANAESQQIDAVVDTGTDIASFLQALEDRGIYRIARLVTFLDGRFARAHPESALQTQDGSIFVDESGLGWLNPANSAARTYNAEIAANAAALFEEVQFDYIRYPGNPRLRVTQETTPAERTSAVTDFTAMAADTVHRIGAAVSFDLFGQTTVVTVEDSIGQIWEEIAAHADYLSPMVYPSTWVVGRFGLAYPPAEPGIVVRASVGQGVERLEGFTAHVRPWLQDFNDYQEQLLPYRALEVKAQIDAAASVGADGFMLWDPSLYYAVSVLAALRDEAAAPD
jgi:hypothetical protein